MISISVLVVKLPWCTHEIPPVQWTIPSVLMNLPHMNHGICHLASDVSSRYPLMYLWYFPGILKILHSIKVMKYKIGDVLLFSAELLFCLFVAFPPESRTSERLCQIRDVSEDILCVSEDIVSLKVKFTTGLHKIFAQRSVITTWLLWHILNWKMSSGSGNNLNSWGLPQKGDLGGFNWIIFTSVINNYILSFSSSLNKVKVKMNGF